MNHITKTIPLLLLTSVFLFKNNTAQASINRTLARDSTEKQREVRLSQQLFAVKISKPKNKKAKPGTFDLKAELRDAFTVIRYENNKSFTELEWSMCPKGKCPVGGTFDFGSPQYKYLDTLMAQVKQANIKAQKNLIALAKSVSKKKH